MIFLFKHLGSPSSTEKAPLEGEYDRSAASNNDLFFAAQTIQNACGTQAILSIILNNDASNPSLPATSAIDIGPELGSFKDFTASFTPDLLGEALSNSNLIRDTHNSFSRSSPFADETQRDPRADADDAFHFIGYTVRNDRLYELDGLQPYPISHGPCTPEDFPNKIIPVLHARMNRYPAEEVRFNLMAVCGDLMARAAEIGDLDSLERQKRKRVHWRWENALRRHNFVGFVGEMLKGVTDMKLQRGEYTSWIEEAKGETRKRLKEERKRGDGTSQSEGEA